MIQTVGDMMNQLTISSDEIRNYKSKSKDDFKIRDMTNFADDVIDYFYKELKSGKSLGFPKMDSGYLCRLSEVNLITGISGHGKTQMLMQWVNHLSKTGKCLVMSMEMRPEISISRLCRIGLGRNSTGAPPTPKFIKEYCEAKKDSIYIYDQTSTTTSDDVFASMIYAKEVLDCDYIIVDSLMTIQDVDEGNDGYNQQKKFINKLSVMAKSLNMAVFLVAHLRKVADELQAPDAQSIYGSSNIRNLVDNIIMIYRNKLKEKWADDKAKTEDELKVMPDCLVYIQKQRNYPFEGKFGFYFNRASMIFQETPL